mmetsp:Transcript_7770/g.14839  ORF Transcript_7770/g.14839 Transcript_7770/m.14839 type:complete len:228 (+) Transcript_7770:4616-5299(+)
MEKMFVATKPRLRSSMNCSSVRMFRHFTSKLSLMSYFMLRLGKASSIVIVLQRNKVLICFRTALTNSKCCICTDLMKISSVNSSGFCLSSSIALFWLLMLKASWIREDFKSREGVIGISEKNLSGFTFRIFSWKLLVTIGDFRNLSSKLIFSFFSSLGLAESGADLSDSSTERLSPSMVYTKWQRTCCRPSGLGRSSSIQSGLGSTSAACGLRSPDRSSLSCSLRTC